MSRRQTTFPEILGAGFMGVLALISKGFFITLGVRLALAL